MSYLNITNIPIEFVSTPTNDLRGKCSRTPLPSSLSSTVCPSRDFSPAAGQPAAAVAAASVNPFVVGGGGNKSPPLPRYNNAASLLKAGGGLKRLGGVQLRPSKSLPLPKLGLQTSWRKTGTVMRISRLQASKHRNEAGNQPSSY